jgi:hypothetical protein
MKEAIKQVIDLDLTKHISIAEKDLYDAEENDRWLAKMTINRQERHLLEKESILLQICTIQYFLPQEQYVETKYVKLKNLTLCK